jgi:hypothetical protein
MFDRNEHLKLSAQAAALCETFSLPAAVLGPQDFFALRRRKAPKINAPARHE